MKLAHNSIIVLLLMAGASLFATGCVEHRYYRENHRHSPRWEERHHRPRVDIDIHN